VGSAVCLAVVTSQYWTPTWSYADSGLLADTFFFNSRPPLNFWRAVSLTEQQFRFSFTNAVSDRESKELYAKYAMPAPGRPFFEAATATLNPNAATKVNVANETRGPLLLISGANDNTAPSVMVKSALNLYHRKSKAVTEFKEFSDRGHSLVLDSGWRELAEYSLGWLRSKNL
jgi:pimeloyl-ACP methyl ester carboxylesterase